jgi:hypothetical protein
MHDHHGHFGAALAMARRIICRRPRESERLIVEEHPHDNLTSEFHELSELAVEAVLWAMEGEECEIQSFGASPVVF